MLVLAANRPNHLGWRRSNKDLVTASQNKSRPFDKHCYRPGGGGGEVSVQRQCWLWVRNTKSLKKRDLGHMLDMCTAF